MTNDDSSRAMEAHVGAMLATAKWRRSTRSGTQGNCVEAAALGDVEWHKRGFRGSESDCIKEAVLETATWRKSRHTGSQGNCVEVAGRLRSVVAVRDSKDPGGAKLIFPAQAWRLFTAALKVMIPAQS